MEVNDDEVHKASTRVNKHARNVLVKDTAAFAAEATRQRLFWRRHQYLPIIPPVPMRLRLFFSLPVPFWPPLDVDDFCFHGLPCGVYWACPTVPSTLQLAVLRPHLPHNRSTRRMGAIALAMRPLSVHPAAFQPSWLRLCLYGFRISPDAHHLKLCKVAAVVAVVVAAEAI